MSDVMMPHMSGTALAHKLRAQRPDLPVVLMSGYAMEVFEREPPPDGALLLQKPFTADAAARAIAPLLPG
jgi:two-component system cell cycle sensor histidine kinase/response regulator CckA